MFALVIAVNNYAHPSIHNLSGCLADADDVIDFLTTNLGLPLSHIRELRNDQATKDTVQKAIVLLAHDDRIQENDPILIYYAGHGAEAAGPLGWPSPNGKIQMLVPYNFVPGDPSRGGVLDISLSHLLTYLSKRKGKNITVIMDSCHSGSGTRQEYNDPEVLVRGIDLPQTYHVPLSAIQNSLRDIRAINGTRAVAIASGHEYNGLHSHVLLSACSETQTAKEKSGRGAFTLALFTKLRDVKYTHTTYRGLIAELTSLPNQNPQCEGVDVDRTIFNTPFSGSIHRVFQITQSSNGAYTIDAGLSSGISTHARFDIYANKSTAGSPLGTLEATIVAPFRARLDFFDSSPSFDFPIPGYALLAQAGIEAGIRLFLNIDRNSIDFVMEAIRNIRNIHPERRGISLVSSLTEQPDLIITASDSLAQFDIMNDECRAHGLSTIPFSPQLNPLTLYPILLSAAEFYWRLRLESRRQCADPLINVECFALVEQGDYDEMFNPILVPDASQGNFNKSGTVRMDADDEVQYGFKITNKYNKSVFLALLYFDMSDLSITSYYASPISKDGVASMPLQPHSFVTVGYGTGGYPPLKPFLRGNQDVDVGFLKVFLSTQYVDYSIFVQESPFSQGETRAMEVSGTRTREAAMLLWDTVTLTVVQHRSIFTS